MTKEQCRAARALLGWSLDELAKQAEIGRNAIHMFEAGNRTPHRATIKSLRFALEQAGVEFLDNGKGPGVRLIQHDDP